MFSRLLSATGPAATSMFVGGRAMSSGFRPYASLYEVMKGMITNRIDRKMIETFGPDRAAAMWVLRNGGRIRWIGESTFIGSCTQYLLQADDDNLDRKLASIHADRALFYSKGFAYLENCSHVKRIRLIDCPYVTDHAIERLEPIADSLRYLTIEHCPITDKSTQHLAKLTNLRKLTLRDLHRVRRPQLVKEQLELALPHCAIEYQSGRLDRLALKEAEHDDKDNSNGHWWPFRRAD